MIILHGSTNSSLVAPFPADVCASLNHWREPRTAVARPSLERSVYFSVVTITTLGFGDLTPYTSYGRFLVAVEVIAGYMLLGLLVSVLATKLVR